jgi:hypothetical protein
VAGQRHIEDGGYEHIRRIQSKEAFATALTQLAEFFVRRDQQDLLVRARDLHDKLVAEQFNLVVLAQFKRGKSTTLIGMALWGVGMGVHESIVPAAVALMVPVQRRASAYGLFTAGYGVFWCLGSALIGILYDVSLLAVIAFSLVIEIAAIPLFIQVRRQSR